MPGPPMPTRSRLAYIDWMRGLACILMFQTHCYDSWLTPAARNSTFFMYSQLGGTLPAPLFLFLAGVSFALVTDKLWRKGLAADHVLRKTLRRGAEIFALGLLFRLQAYVIAWGWAPWTDLFRVDILNTIGASMMLMALVCWLISGRELTAWQRVSAAAATAGATSLLTPLLWTTWRPRWIPWPIQSYIDGVHNLGEPQAWLFPIFPWSAFAFAGLAAGFVLAGRAFQEREARSFAWCGALGVGMIFLSRWLDRQPHQWYSVYDYWHTSPNFFLLRVGILLIVLSAAYAWCRWGFGGGRFSPLIQLGQTSLLVYWVHIELVYGRLSILRKHAQNIPAASIGLGVIFALMLLLSIARTRAKWDEVWAGWRKTAAA
jgi:uncharacterized membrane protein